MWGWLLFRRLDGEYGCVKGEWSDFFPRVKFTFWVEGLFKAHYDEVKEDGRVEILPIWDLSCIIGKTLCKDRVTFTLKTERGNTLDRQTLGLLV